MLSSAVKRLTKIVSQASIRIAGRCLYAIYHTYVVSGVVAVLDLFDKLRSGHGVSGFCVLKTGVPSTWGFSDDNNRFFGHNLDSFLV